MDIVDELEERAKSYDQSGPSAKHTADLLRKARHEIHELRRTRSEAQANARVAGYREGATGVVAQLRALNITVNTESH